MQIKKIIKKSLRVFGILLFIYVLSRVNWPEFMAILMEINVFYFSLSVFFVILATLARVLKWKALVDSTGAKVPVKTIIHIFARGLFLGVITPGKLGDLYRAKYLADEAAVPLKKAFYTVVFDKIFDFFYLAFWSILAIFGLIYLFGFGAEMLPVAFILVLIAGLGFYLIVKREHSQNLFKMFLKIFIPDSLKEKTEIFFNSFFEEVGKVTRALILKLLCYELASYALFFALAYLFASLSLGLEIPFWYFYLIIPIIVIIVNLPISVLGLGTREVSSIFLLSLVNINLNQAVTFSILIMFLTIVSGIPGFVLMYSPVKISNKNAQ